MSQNTPLEMILYVAQVVYVACQAQKESCFRDSARFKYKIF